MEIYTSKEELLEKAGIISKSADKEFQESLKLYFIARYFVSLYEAKFNSIPVQVWNEYRNSLDHFFRSKTNPNDNHVRKMQGHIQRAVLDILKLYCHSIQDLVSEIDKQYSTDVLKLVDNGNFIKNIKLGTSASVSLFEKAKIADGDLGENSHTNSEIVGKYLEAAYSFENVRKSIIDKEIDILQASQSYQSIHDKVAKGTFKEHIKTHYIFYISWVILTSLLQYGYNYFSK